MLSLRYWSLSQSVPINRNIMFSFGERIKPRPRRRFYYSSSPLRRICRSISSCTASFSLNEKVYVDDNKQPSSFSNNSPISGVEDDLMGYISGKKKATEVAHSIWKQVVQKGDTVVDATCGNGYDTLAMLKMVANESGTGCVYGFDIQGEALESTSSLLDENANPQERGIVKLFNICHSNMEKVVSERTSVRLVAFNLGYLPGGDKTVITMSNTTLLALEAAKRILTPGGLISLVVYIGHPGGREELETVEAFVNELSVDDWICCKFQMLNRPLAPVLVFLFKRDILV